MPGAAPEPAPCGSARARSSPGGTSWGSSGFQSLEQGEMLHREVKVLLSLWYVWCSQTPFIRVPSALTLTSVTAERSSFVSHRRENVENAVEAWLLGP